MDKHDSVGVLDSYFPDADFFTEFERFDRHCEKLKRDGKKIDYLTVCSPNYLHDAHIRFGLRLGADVICEKPVVLNPWNVDALSAMENETGRKIYSIVQLRYHPAVKTLRERLGTQGSDNKIKIKLSYITSRGRWYQHSWKGDINKSGGIATNIGIHFFDFLVWIFGPALENRVESHTARSAKGNLVFERAEVGWFLSIDPMDLPKTSNGRSFRSVLIDGQEMDLGEGMELHTFSYEEIIAGRGFRISDIKDSIKLVHDIRNYRGDQDKSV